MKVEESTYSGHDGTEMLLRIWHPDTASSRGPVVGIHGLGSHSGLMSFMAESFAEKGFTFYAPDLRGFGTFSGMKGHVESFDEYIDDMHALMKLVREKQDSGRLILFGHSLGGLHVIRYIARHPDEVDATIIPCPAVSERLKMGSATRAIASLLAKVNSKKYFDTGLDLDLLSRNPDVVQRHRDDPLRFDKATPRFAVEGLKAREKGSKLGPKITIPVLLQQAGEDLILVPEANKEFFETIASEDKTWKLYEGFYHDPFEDPGGDEVMRDMFEWIDQRFPP